MIDTNKLGDLKIELSLVKNKINALVGTSDYTDRVAKHFHLGMVGGSGKGTTRLNKIRERSLDKTIENAKALTELYKQEGKLEAQIQDLENDGPAKRSAAKEKRNALRAEYWKSLKVGDELNVGNPSGNPVITKISRKSIITTGGCKWAASEIIGKEAAALL